MVKDKAGIGQPPNSPIEGRHSGASAPLGVAALGLAVSLWGIAWGLPSSGLVERALPAGINTPEFRQRLTGSWSDMHKRLGENLMLNPESFNDFSGVLRVPGGWGDPPDLMLGPARSFFIRSEHEDEQTILIMLSRLKPHKLELNPHMFTYGGAYVYSVGASLALGWAAGLVTLHRGLGPYLEEPSRMAAMYLAGRLLSVAATVGSALLLLRYGRRHWDAAVGTLAAVFFLLTPASILQSHVLKNHAFWTFFAILTVGQSAEALLRGRSRDYAWAGAAAGLTVGSFLPGWPACLVVAWAGLLGAASGRPWRGELKGVALAAACAAGAFLITNPYWALELGEALAEMKVLGRQSGFDLLNPLRFLREALRPTMTAPVLALMLAGAALALRRRLSDRFALLCACAFLTALAAVALTHEQNVTSASYVRYFSGWAAVGSLLTARAAMDLWRARSRWQPVLRAAVIAMGLNLALHGLTYAQNFRLASTRESTHWRSGRWIEDNVPRGSTIGLLRLPQPSNCPFFPLYRYDLLFIKPELFKALPISALPAHLVVTVPTYDDRPLLGANLGLYEKVAVFDRARLAPWAGVDPGAMSANPLIEVYRLKNG